MNKPVLKNAFRAVLVLLAMAVSLAGPLEANCTEGQQTDTGRDFVIFHGAWFDVRYPPGFRASPSLKSSTADGYDSAEFISADGTVSFYVYAPQWSGNATDIALIPEREVLATEQHRKLAERETRWFTIAAKDNSYQRSYQETVSQQGSTKTILGVKYRNPKTLARYQKAYEQFRNSLKLYAD